MVLAALFLSIALCASPSADLTPDEIERVDALFERWAGTSTPGCALAIVKNGELALSRGYGMADLEHEVALTADSVFRIASTSKQFTAACILLLEQDGVLSLEDDLRKWLPEIRAPRGTIRLRHLLHHTSGLRDYLWLMGLAGYEDAGYYDEDAAFDMLARQEDTQFEPGERFAYCNSGYFLLSLVVERASGRRMHQFAEERIFAPLGMSRTHFHDDHTELVPGRALGYSENAGTFRLNMTRLEMCGDGGVFTTVQDLTRWMANFREPVVGGDALLKRMLEPGLLNDGTVLDYASGLGVDPWKGMSQVSHGGAFAGFRAEMLHLPELGFGVVCLSNLGEFAPTSRCEEVRDLLLGAAPIEESEADASSEEFEPATVERDALRAWEGTWLEIDGALPHILRISARRSSLQLRGAGVGQRFLPTSERAFRSAKGDVRLEFIESETEPAALLLAVDDHSPVRFRRVEEFAPNANELAAYQGDYWSEELQTTYRLRLEEDALLVRLLGSEIGTLVPELRDRFRGPGASQLLFERKDEALVGFRLHQPGVGGLRFERREL